MKLPPVHIPGCPHCPTVPQGLGLSLPNTREILYGGAAGGGKSDWLLMGALQHIDVPTYSAIIFRRTFPQLSAAENGLLARAQSWLEGNPKFHGSDTVNGMPTRWKYQGGGTLSFSHMQLERDKYNHQGPEYQFIGWDELTQFTLSQYLYLLGRLRKLESFDRLPLRVRSASNPGGSGHEWVRERFPIPISGKRRPMAERRFIPARLQDNPYLDRDEYARTLAELPEYERAQLLDGNWDARPPGAFFKRERFPILDSPPAPQRTDEVRRWDIAATEGGGDATSGVRMGRVAGPIPFVVSDVQQGHWSPEQVEKRVVHTAQVDGRGVSIRMEQEPGASGKIVIANFRRMLEGFDFRGVPSTGSKYQRAKGCIAAHEREEIGLVRGPWVEDFLRRIELVDFEGSEHDDDGDALAGAYADLTNKGLSFEDLYPEPAEGAAAHA